MAEREPKEIAPGITVDPRVRFGRPVIKGSRVDVVTILGHIAAGDTPAEVAAAYSLTRDQVLAAVSYAAEIISQEEVRAFP
jgi:uncharacterized protein (DUF433 family)